MASKNSKTKNKVDSKFSKYKDRQVDVEAVKKAISDKGYTQSRVAKILGVTTSTFWHWEHRDNRANPNTVFRIADLLEVPVDSLYKEEYTIVAETEKPTTEAVEDTLSVAETNIKFQEIGETQNVQALFNIVNSNIITLSNVLNDYIDKKFDDLYSNMHKAFMELKQSETTQNAKESAADDTVKTTKKQKPKVYIVDKEKAEDLIKGYNEKDSYEEYKSKVNHMTQMIYHYTKIPQNQILHGLYIEMTNTYGVVYAQLKKEYFEKYQHAANGSLELIYENAIFRQIFYNLLSDKLKTEVKISVALHSI